MSLAKKIGVLVIIEIALIGGWFLFVDSPPPLEEPQANNETEDVVDDGDNEREVEDDEEQIDETETDPDTSKEEDTPQGSGIVLLQGVPFTPQAPFANWNDSRQQDGCEEAAALMAVRWARGESLTLAQAENEIVSSSDWQLQNHGEYRDVSAQDTVNRIIKGYFGYSNAEVRYGITAQEIVTELERGNIVIVPTDGRLLGNPYFTPPGPERHMFVVKGYDHTTGEFIVNDNGTRYGESMRYGRNTLFNAIMDYPTGYHEPIQSIVKAMIVVKK